MTKAITAAKMLIKDYFCSYRTNKSKFVFQMLVYLNFVFLLPILILPREFVVQIYRALISIVSTFMGVSTLHALVFRMSPVLSTLVFLYLFLASDTLKLTDREHFLAIHPVSLFDILLARTIYQTFVLLGIMIAYAFLFYLGTYVAGYSFSPALAYFVLVISMVTFGILVETGKFLNYLKLRWLWLILAFLSILDYFRGNLTVSLVVYFPIISILNCYTNLNVFPALIEFFAVLAVFYAVSNAVNPDLEEVGVARRKEKSEKSFKIISPLRKSLIEFERTVMVYSALMLVAAVLVAFAFGKLIATHLSIYWAKMAYFYAILLVSSVVEGISAQEASFLWFYRVASKERSYVLASVTKGVLVTLSLVLPLAVLVYPVLGFQSLSILALFMLIPPYYTFVATYLCSKTKMKVTKLLNVKKELEDVRFILLIFELPIIIFFSFMLFIIPKLSFIVASAPLLLIPVLERSARSVEIV